MVEDDLLNLWAVITQDVNMIPVMRKIPLAALKVQEKPKPKAKKSKKKGKK